MTEPIDPTTQRTQQTPPVVDTSVEQGKTTAIIAYITVIGLIIALILNMDKKNTFAAFHIKQSLGLMLTGLAVSFISWIPFLGWLIGLVAAIVLLYMWIVGVMNAVNGRAKPLPVLGERYSEWFKTF